MPIVPQLGRVATITAVEDTLITLLTPDGWTRTIDVSGIPITRGSTTITAADLEVGTRVRVAQRRTADGSWQVARIGVLLSTTLGTVAAVGPDGFEVTTPRGTVVTVRVSDATTWVTTRRGSVGLDTLQVGARVLVRGIAAADGSIDATTVATVGQRASRRARPGGDPTPAMTPAPIATPTPSTPST